MEAPKRTPRWIVPAIGGLVLLSLGLSLAGEFVWDDHPLIVQNSLIKKADRLGDILTRGFWESDDSHDRFRAFFRPVVIVSYLMDYTVWGPEPFGFHLTNLLLHFACCLLVLRLTLDEGLDPRAGFAGAALFAVHPVHVESVSWISGRTDLIACLLMLAAFACHTRREGRLPFRVASWLLFGCALYSKEMAATLPAVVAVSAWLSGPLSGRLRRATSASAPFFAILGLYLLSRLTVLESAAGPLYTLGVVSWVATGLFVVSRYLTLLLLPLGLDAHYPYKPIETLADPRVVIGALMLAVLVFAAWRLARVRSRALFWLAWAAVTLTPVLLFGRFGDILLADRFLYIPSVGAALLAAFGIHAVMRVERAGVCRGGLAATALLVGLLSVLSVSRTLVWADDERLFTDMLETSPHSALVHNNLGLAMYHSEDLPNAIEHFQAATELAPEYALAFNNLAAAQHRAGQVAEALANYELALKHAPRLMMALANRGHLLVELGRADRGLAALREAVEVHPKAPTLLYALADSLVLDGQPEEALVWLDRIRQVDPGFPERFYLLGKIHYQAGRIDQAAEAMSLFLDRRDGVGPQGEFAREVLRRAQRRAASTD